VSDVRHALGREELDAARALVEKSILVGADRDPE